MSSPRRSPTANNLDHTIQLHRARFQILMNSVQVQRTRAFTPDAKLLLPDHDTPLLNVSWEPQPAGHGRYAVVFRGT